MVLICARDSAHALNVKQVHACVALVAALAEEMIGIMHVIPSYLW